MCTFFLNILIAPLKIQSTHNETNTTRSLKFQSTYNETIPEHSPAGTVVVRLVAQDRDLGDYGVIRYTLFHDPLNAFSIDSVTVSILCVCWFCKYL